MAQPYEAQFSIGSRVRIADRSTLETFRREWSYHNPLKDEQLLHAGRSTTVVEIGYYHGGDALYKLEGVPGVWHEPNLLPDSAHAADQV